MEGFSSVIPSESASRGTPALLTPRFFGRTLEKDRGPSTRATLAQDDGEQTRRSALYWAFRAFRINSQTLKHYPSGRSDDQAAEVRIGYDKIQTSNLGGSLLGGG